jgi:eukaryotic-like serine/threonine-protein kinase
MEMASTRRLQDACPRDKVNFMPEPTVNYTSPDNAPTWPSGPTASAVASASESLRFGDYELLREVARGGMGIVYRARQVSLDRVVALKMILAGRLATPEDLLRFRTEAEAAGRLKHPNIVAVHEVSEVDGQHFFSMDFIEGVSLTDKLRSGPLPSRVAARYVRTIARAVHHAHRQGVLHRDLKPSNILLDADDEPHITDFGLAKRLGGDSGQTRTGVVLGTPSYMSPEQAAGRTHELGPACDVYGLGAVLYELLTGRPPFRSETPLDTVMQVIEQDPVPPRLLNPKIDHDLETICLKCLEKSPERRYPSAEALAEDLDRYLNDETISARSINVLDRLVRSLDRSHHVVDFHAWSTMILFIAAVVFIEHVVVHLLVLTDQPVYLAVAARFSQFVLIGWLFWRYRGRQLLPHSAAERELWTIWIGYILAYVFGLVTVRSMIYFQIISAGAGSPSHWQTMVVYPFSAIASGLAFFIMGSNYWGRFYVIGLAFFLLAALMPMHLEWASLEFGTLWGAILLVLGLHLRNVGKQAQADGTHPEQTNKAFEKG